MKTSRRPFKRIKIRNTELETLKREVKKTDPHLTKFLPEDFSITDKCELLELHELYKISKEESRLEQLQIKKDFNNKLEQSRKNQILFEKFSEEEHASFKKEEKKLEENNEISEMKYTILSLPTSEKNRRVIYNAYKRLENKHSSDEEYHKLKHWLDCAVSLPFDRMTSSGSVPSQIPPSLSGSVPSLLMKVKKRLDEKLYGMESVKEQILLFLNARIRNPDMKRCSLGLIGNPGCGKTTIIRVLAETLSIPLEQISLGGITTPDFLKGHMYTYIGATCGEIANCLRRMKVKNGILFFDEFDKISANKDVCSSLLHITDFSQNNKFQDNFLNGIDIDLSHLWMIYSMNKIPTDEALADRIFYVEIEGYTEVEKKIITKDYVLKTALLNAGLKETDVCFEEKALSFFIEKVSNGKGGIRGVEHKITSIVNKINFLYHNQDEKGKLKIGMSFDIYKKIKFPLRLDIPTLKILLGINDN